MLHIRQRLILIMFHKYVRLCVRSIDFVKQSRQRKKFSTRKSLRSLVAKSAKSSGIELTVFEISA